MKSLESITSKGAHDMPKKGFASNRYHRLGNSIGVFG